MKIKKVSVMIVTPVYCTEQNQRLPLLLQSIYWIRQQTCKDIIHVIVNDGSTDQTPKLLDKIALHNPSIIVYHKKNGGEGSAINFGIKKALVRFSPDYITISHSDDLLTPSSVEDRLKLAKKTRAKMVYSDSVTFHENRNPPFLERAIDTPNSKILYFSLLKHKHMMPYPTMFWERDFFIDHLKCYDEKLGAAQDWDIALRSARALYKTGSRFSIIHKVTAAQRIHHDNLRSIVNKDGTRWKAYKKILAKHLKGKSYKLSLTRQAFRILRFNTPSSVLKAISIVRHPQIVFIPLLPDPVRKSLRYLRSLILPPLSPPYRNEWIDNIGKIDYHSELIPK